MQSKTSLRAAALSAVLALAGTVQAGGLDACDVDSEFDLRISDRAIVFHRDSGTPEQVEMRGGQLLVDGEPQRLSAADTRRVIQFEHKVRDLLPEVMGIAAEAVDIAHGAVLQVARALAGEDDTRIARMTRELDAARDDAVAAFNAAEFDTARFEQRIEGLVEELVPVLVGDVTAIAISAAMSGDEARVRELEQRMEHMEQAIEVQVEQRAQALEARAEALCPLIAELDALEDSFDFRLADNRPLDLLDAGRGN